jgi:hypothetical protein
MLQPSHFVRRSDESGKSEKDERMRWQGNVGLALDVGRTDHVNFPARHSLKARLDRKTS